MDKEKKVYEVPETMVHSINFKPIMQTSSPGSGNNGTGESEEGSRRLWLEDDEY